MSTSSTYMGFPISTVGVDTGLAWEQNLNAALTVIDQHNHSSGQGQQITPGGLNINSDLSFGSNNATLLRAARFSPQASPIANTGADVGEIYVSGNELYYNDVTGGNQVQLTLAGAVFATSFGITSGTASAAFSAGTLLVKSSSTSFGSVALQSVLLSNSGNLTNQLTLQAPVLSGSNSITLPAIPAATNFVTLDNSGNLNGSVPIAHGITRPNLAAVGQQISASSGFFNTSSSTYVPITNLTVTITTTGRPVMVFFQPDTTNASSLVASCPTTGATGKIKIDRDAGAIDYEYVFGLEPTSGGVALAIPPGSILVMDLPSAGVHTYTAYAQASTAGTSTNISLVKLVAYEL